MNFGFARPLAVSSLILISIGNGCIRACITSLGGSQFELPSQSKGLDQYFSHYYFIYSFGILLSKIIPPEIRAQTQCFGKTDCYTAVFGTLGAFFVIAWCEFPTSISFILHIFIRYQSSLIDLYLIEKKI